MKFVVGQERVVAKIEGLAGTKIAAIADAMENVAVDIANHAKAGHIGVAAHAEERYQNQTSNLTNSIQAGDTEVGEGSPSLTCDVFATMEYAPYVEEIYPFMMPALHENAENFRDQVAEAAKGK